MINKYYESIKYFPFFSSVFFIIVTILHPKPLFSNPSCTYVFEDATSHSYKSFYDFMIIFSVSSRIQARIFIRVNANLSLWDNAVNFISFRSCFKINKNEIYMKLNKTQFIIFIGNSRNFHPSIRKSEHVQNSGEPGNFLFLHFILYKKLRQKENKEEEEKLLNWYNITFSSINHT